jgi:hypothetical protein
MQALLNLLSEYQLDFETRAYAHYVSSNYHRRWGVIWSIGSAVFTAVASIVTLVGTAFRLGVFKPIKLELGPSGLLIIAILAIILFAFATVSALAAFLAHPKQAATHMSSYAGYSHAMRRLETLRLRCINSGNTNADPEMLLNTLDEISQEIKEVAAASIYPTPEAYISGKREKQFDLEFKKEWKETFGP